MNFIKPKEVILSEVWSRTELQIRNSLHNTLFQGANHDPHSTVNILTQAITAGIVEAARVLVENTYTDQEFEEDIGLKDRT